MIRTLALVSFLVASCAIERREIALSSRSDAETIDTITIPEDMIDAPAETADAGVDASIEDASLEADTKPPWWADVSNEVFGPININDAWGPDGDCIIVPGPPGGWVTYHPNSDGAPGCYTCVFPEGHFQCSCVFARYAYPICERDSGAD